MFSPVAVYRKQPLVSLSLVILSVLSGGLTLLQPMFSAKLIESVGNWEKVYQAVTGLVGVIVLSGIVLGISGYLSARFHEDGLLWIRSSVLERQMQLPLARIAKLPPSQYSSRVLNDAPLVLQSAKSLLQPGLIACITLVGATIFSIYLAPLAFMLAIACGVIAVVMLLLFTALVKRKRIEIQASISRMYEVVQDIFDNLPIIRHYRSGNYFYSKIRRQLETIRERELSLVKLQAVIEPISTIILQSSLVVAFIVAAIDVAQGKMSLGSMIGFVFYYQILTSALQEILDVVASFQEGAAGKERLQQMCVSFDNNYKSNHENCRKDSFISLINVTVQYGNNKVLEGIDIDIPAKLTTAIVGLSAAGKTTILNIIAGFVNPVSGDVIAPRNNPGGRFVGYVDQSSSLIEGSLEENVRLGRDGITQGEIINVLKDVGLAKYATTDGVKRVIKRNAAFLSAGERQRVALARALVTHPEVLLLDEPTANVDGIIEDCMLEAIEKYAPDATVVVVAHRVKTICSSDYLVYVENGMVIDAGEPRECIQKNKRLRTILGSQGLQ